MQASSSAKLISSLLPKLELTKYKGQNGKIFVVGGSEEYTGAPYYSAISNLRAGSDLSYVICSEKASIPIKSYSPEIIVYPFLEQPELIRSAIPPQCSVVVGPGLGRHNSVAPALKALLDVVKANEKIQLIGDADFLWFLSCSEHKFELLDKMETLTKRTILTPNQIEFQRLYTLLIDDKEFTNESSQKKQQMEIEFYEQNKNSVGLLETEFGNDVKKLSAVMNNTLIFRKGIVDIISDGEEAYYVSIEGSKKRCGGQGDVLCGIMSSFINFKENLKEHEEYQNKELKMAAIASSIVMRQSACIAFREKGISLVTPDIIEVLPKVLRQYDQSVPEQKL